MSRPLFLAVLAFLAAPAGAAAAPAKVSPHPSTVSPGGRATVEVANPNLHTLRGTAAVTVAGVRVVARRVVLPRRSVTTVALSFDARARKALRSAGGRATITLRLRRTGGPMRKVGRRVTLRFAAATPQAPAPVTGPAPGGDAEVPQGPVPTRPVSDKWAGRTGGEGPYDDFELTVSGGRMQFTRAPAIPVSCFENGGAHRSALSFELFAAPGPWTVGSDESVAQDGIALNQLVHSGARPITYKVTGTSMSGASVTGTLGMSFFDSRYDPFSNTITYVNCAGAQSFEAVPAG